MNQTVLRRPSHGHIFPLADGPAARELALDIELARKIDEKRRDWEVQVRLLANEESQLKVKDKDKTIEDLKRLLDEARY